MKFLKQFSLSVGFPLIRPLRSFLSIKVFLLNLAESSSKNCSRGSLYRGKAEVSLSQMFVELSCFSAYSAVHFADEVLEDLPLKVHPSSDALEDFPCISFCFFVFAELAGIFFSFRLC